MPANLLDCFTRLIAVFLCSLFSCSEINNQGKDWNEDLQEQQKQKNNRDYSLDMGR
jgi:hypothetical protein